MNQNELAEYLKGRGILKSKAVIKAFKEIDRADFVLPEFKNSPYGDYPLSIGHEQTISQPTTVAFMVSLLSPKPGEKILDVGAGSGWTTALLSKLVGPKGKVFGTEIIFDLVKFSKSNLTKYNLANAEIIRAGEELGLPSEAPFDKILVSAAARDLPPELVKQLKVGGRLVLPIENSIWVIEKVSEDKIEKQEFPGFVFVPLRH